MNLPPGPIEPNAANPRGPSAEGPVLRDFATVRKPARPPAEPSRPAPSPNSGANRVPIPHWSTWFASARLGRADLGVTLCALAATFIGLIAIFDAGYVRSLARDQSLMPPEMRSQLTWLLPSLFVYIMGRVIPFALIRRASIGIFVTSTVMLLMVEVIGTTFNAAKRWISVAGQSFQPSEFAKLAVILYVAQMLAWKEPAPTPRPAGTPRPRWTVADWIIENVVPFTTRVLPFVPAFIAMFLVERGSDLGTAGVILAIALVMFFAARVRLQSWIIGGSVVAVVLALFVTAQPYRMERINHHQARWSIDNVDDIGYQTTQSERGMADGALIGVGVGNGHVKHIIPATTNDFVMATIGEETGLVGASVVILVLGVLAVRLASLMRAAASPFARYVIAGVSGWIAVQACVNIMMANGTLPAIGIPVPFVSSGGSSLVALWAALSIAQSAALTGAGKRAQGAERSEKEEGLETRDHWRRDRRTHFPGA